MPSPALLGVLSDTHGRAVACRAGVELLQDLGVEAFVHCGDIGDFGPYGDPKPVLDVLAGTGCHYVWGNNDGAAPADEKYARDLGLDPLGDRGHFMIGDVRIRVEHGDDLTAIRRLARDAEAGRDAGCDLLLTGHSHAAHDRRLGLVRWVNPGALHRATTYTVATIDIRRLGDDDAVVFHALPRA